MAFRNGSIHSRVLMVKSSPWTVLLFLPLALVALALFAVFLLTRLFVPARPSTGAEATGQPQAVVRAPAAFHPGAEHGKVIEADFRTLD